MGTLNMEKGGMPQDVKISPDGKVFYVADMEANGIYLVEGDLNEVGFIPTGKGAHGLYVSRDSKVLYVSNRGEGSLTVIDLATRKIPTKWRIPRRQPGHGRCFRGRKTLWLAGRYHREVYVFDTTTVSCWPNSGR